MQRLTFIALMCLLLSACGNSAEPTVYETTYDVQATTTGSANIAPRQFFDVTAEQLTSDLQSAVEEYGLSLRLDWSNSGSSAYLYTDTATGYNILVDVVTDADIKYSKANSCGEPTAFLGCVESIEVDMFTATDVDAVVNGQLIRGLIATLTPDSEEFVEDTIGLYGEPHEDAIIADNVFRVSVENVAYTYIPEDSFTATPYDFDLVAVLEAEQASPADAVKPS